MLAQWEVVQTVVAHQAEEARLMEATVEAEMVAVVMVTAGLVGVQEAEVGPGGAALAYLVAAQAVVELVEGVWVVVA